MIDPNNVPPIADDELLARFITQAKQFRPSDQTVKPDLFIPFRLTELSFTRHRDATIEEFVASRATGRGAAAAGAFRSLGCSGVGLCRGSESRERRRLSGRERGPKGARHQDRAQRGSFNAPISDWSDHWPLSSCSNPRISLRIVPIT